MKKFFAGLVLASLMCLPVLAQNEKPAPKLENYECLLYVLTSAAGTSNIRVPKSFNNVVRSLREQYQIENPRIAAVFLQRMTNRSSVSLVRLPIFRESQSSPDSLSVAFRFMTNPNADAALLLDQFRITYSTNLSYTAPEGVRRNEIRESDFNSAFVPVNLQEPNLMTVLPDYKSGENLAFVLVLNRLP